MFEDLKNPQRFHLIETTEDERFEILDVSDRGTGKQGNAVFVRDLSRPSRNFVPLIPAISDDSFFVLDNIGGELLVYTDKDAPKGRVLRVDPDDPAEPNWKTVLRRGLIRSNASRLPEENYSPRI